MKKYKQLNYEERITIAVLQREGKNQRAIAKYLKRSPGTINREISRGITSNDTYFADSSEKSVKENQMRNERER